jgi:hypothetical protein
MATDPTTYPMEVTEAQVRVLRAAYEKYMLYHGWEWGDLHGATDTHEALNAVEALIKQEKSRAQALAKLAEMDVAVQEAANAVTAANLVWSDAMYTRRTFKREHGL